MKSDASKARVDEFTGRTTTGHEWDGIEELNTPLPRWWLWTFYACIIWSVAYWVVYPAWPLLSSHTAGMLGYSSRAAVEGEISTANAAKAQMIGKIAETPVAQIAANRELFEFAIARGRAAFGDNCAACHGAGAAGSKGYPNLNDDDWLWGGTIEQIYQTIQHGIRAPNDDETRVGPMPAFGRDEILKAAEIEAVADYVRSLSNLPAEKSVDLASGKKIFEDNCAACHGAEAKGSQEVGAPNLTDAIWLYGSSKETIVQTVTNGRGGVMPAWGKRLDDPTIKSLAVYVHSLGGGQK